MKRSMLAAAIWCAAAMGQTAPPPAADLAESMARRLGESLHVKTVVGKPVVAGSVTLIPILTIDVSFGGVDVPMPPPKPGEAKPEAGGFVMNGEARPLGFVAITKKGTKFLTLPQAAKGGQK